MTTFQLVPPSPPPTRHLPPVEHAPRVITPSFLDSLVVLNKAIRALREMGLHVVWVRTIAELPQAHIYRDNETSIAPLLDSMGPRTYRRIGGANVASGMFQNVLVSWIEPSTSQINPPTQEAP